jgi:hypothetical protein
MEKIPNQEIKEPHWTLDMDRLGGWPETETYLAILHLRLKKTIEKFNLGSFKITLSNSFQMLVYLNRYVFHLSLNYTQLPTYNQKNVKWETRSQFLIITIDFSIC